MVGNRMIVRGAALLGLILGLSARAEASLITFDLSYSGDSYGNSATGRGTITLDTGSLHNPGHTDYSLTTPFVKAFSLTISGAASGSNGTFDLADYIDNGGSIYLDTGTKALNLSRELIGQSTGNQSYDYFGTFSGAGGFGFTSNGYDSAAPTEAYSYTIVDPSGEQLLLTNFTPIVTSVPEPSTLAGAGMLALCGLAYLRRRSRVD